MDGLPVALASAAVLLVHTILVVHNTLGRHLRDRKALCACALQCLTRCRSLLARARDSVARRASLASAEGSGDAHIMAVCVAEALQVKRERIMRDSCRIYAQLLSIVVFIGLYRQVAASVDWVTQEQRLSACATVLLCCYVGYWPRNRSKMTLRLWFFLVVILGHASFLISGSQSFVLLMDLHSLCITPRILFSVIMMDANFVSLANVIYSGFFCAVVHRRQSTDTDMLSPTDALGREAMTLFAIFVCALASQALFAANSQKAIELRASKSEACAAVRVLNVMGHAVVQLDDRLRVADQETKLAALLMHGPGRVLTGSNFSQYFQCEDEHRSFLEWLEAPKDSLDEGNAFATRLRDCTGNPVLVNMFHVPFEWLPGVVRHFIGIRQRAADDVGGGALDAFRPPAGTAETHPVTSEGNSAAASDAADPGDGSMSQDDGLPAFMLNAATLLITGCSTGATLVAHGALKPGTILTDRLSQCETNKLFFVDYAKTLGTLLARARGSQDPVETGCTTAMMVRQKGSYDHFRLDVRLIYHSHWAERSDRLDRAKPPCVEILGVITNVAHERVSFISDSSTSSSTVPLPSIQGQDTSLQVPDHRVSL